MDTLATSMSASLRRIFVQRELRRAEKTERKAKRGLAGCKALASRKKLHSSQSSTRHAINATAFIHTGTHQRQRKRTNRRLPLRRRPRISPLPSQATSLRPPRLLNLRRAGPIHRRGSLQRLRLTRRRYQVRQRRRRKARRSRRRMRRIRRPSRSSRPTIRHGPRFRSRPPGPCRSRLIGPRRRCCRPRP